MIRKDEDPLKQAEGKGITREEIDRMVHSDRVTRHCTTGEEDDDARCKPKGTTSLTGGRAGSNRKDIIEVHNSTNWSRMNRRGDDPLIIHGYILRSATISIYIDTGSATNTMKKSSFQALPRELRNTFKPETTSWSTHGEHTPRPLGTTRLPITLLDHEGSKQRTETVVFTITNALTAYDGPLGRNALWTLGALPSTVHGLLKFKTQSGTVTFFGGNGDNIFHEERIGQKQRHEEDQARKRAQTTKDDAAAGQEEWKEPLMKRMKKTDNRIH